MQLIFEGLGFEDSTFSKLESHLGKFPSAIILFGWNRRKSEEVGTPLIKFVN